MICQCGKRIENIIGSFYQVRRFDDEGNVIFEICVHGHVVINSGIASISTQELNKLQEEEDEYKI